MANGKRIIPISSGKGGVGKTTFAVNYALSLARHGRTLLIDLDTGTSSVRNCLDTPVERDLYHFFKKGHALSDCITTLSPKLDPRGHFKNFGFIAAPKHMIEDITNFTPARREQLIDAINALNVPFVILDLKSGLDANVVEFLPYSNSGVLVFTPHLPAATLAASDIVKAILFRKLRAIFAPDSPVYAELHGIKPDFVNSLIDRVEDTYDDSVKNLDAFVADLGNALGHHPIVSVVSRTIDAFSVHFVLNMFNGVKDSYDTAIKPFMQNLAENVSGGLTILNLGWIIAHQDINKANMKRIPIMLQPEEKPAAAPKKDAAALELARIAAQYLGVKPGVPRPAPNPFRPDPNIYLDSQLEILKNMYDDMKGTGYRENFKYLSYRSLHIMSSRRASDFGDVRIFKQSEMQQALSRRGGR
jgi:MinD-like ATPase involved in chromosome partitioning or flagellar assembly